MNDEDKRAIVAEQLMKPKTVGVEMPHSGGIAVLIISAACLVAVAGYAFYRSYAENEDHYEFVLDPGELVASGSIRWVVRNDSSEARVWINVGTSRENWQHELEHDSDGRVVRWSFRSGERRAEWRVEDGVCTLTMPEGTQTEEGCAPLPHPLLQPGACWDEECSYSSPNQRFTALETRVWRRGDAGTSASGREMRSVVGSNGEVWWFASGDHWPDYMTLPGGLTWMRSGAPVLPGALRQAPPLSVSGDPPVARSQAVVNAAPIGAEAALPSAEATSPTFSVSGDAPGETPSTAFEISGPGVTSIEALALNAGRQMGARTRGGTIRITMLPEPGSVTSANDESASARTDSPAASALAEEVVRQISAEIEPRRTAARVSADVVAERGFGDCTDMAVLAVARLQEKGIHARMVAGVAYIDGWALHAWVEFEERGAEGTHWRSADPTTGDVPAPADRIRLATDLDGMERLSGAIELRSL